MMPATLKRSHVVGLEKEEGTALLMLQGSANKALLNSMMCEQRLRGPSPRLREVRAPVAKMMPPARAEYARWAAVVRGEQLERLSSDACAWLRDMAGSESANAPAFGNSCIMLAVLPVVARRVGCCRQHMKVEGERPR